MAFIDIHADFSRVANAVERIAVLLEWLVRFKADPALTGKQYREFGLVDLQDVAQPVREPGKESRLSAPSNEDLWAAEMEDEMRRAEGLPPERADG